MKKRLLMILGAGASLECGMPRVGEIDALMLNWAQQAASAYGKRDFYGSVWEALGPHLAQGFETNRAIPNFERALNDLAALMHWARPPPEGGALRAWSATIFARVDGSVRTPILTSSISM